MALGRPRDSRLDHTIQAATYELLNDVGYAKLTMDTVAARAGVGKAAIYRRYASKAELVFAVVVHGYDLKPPEDKGSLRADLAALLAEIQSRMSSPIAAATIPGLFAEMFRDPQLTVRYRETFARLERASVAAILERAKARGEIGDEPDTALVHAIVQGTTFSWLFVLGQAADESLPQRLAAIIAPGLSDTPSAYLGHDDR